MNSLSIEGNFHFTNNSLTNNVSIENGLRARIIKNIDEEIGTPIEFILPVNDKIYFGENKKVKIKVVSPLFIQQEISEKKPLIVCFSRTMLLGVFYPC